MCACVRACRKCVHACVLNGYQATGNYVMFTKTGNASTADPWQSSVNKNQNTRKIISTQKTSQNKSKVHKLHEMYILKERLAPSLPSISGILGNAVCTSHLIRINFSFKTGHSPLISKLSIWSIWIREGCFCLFVCCCRFKQSLFTFKKIWTIKKKSVWALNKISL